MFFQTSELRHSTQPLWIPNILHTYLRERNGIIKWGKICLLIADTLKSDRSHVTIDVHQVEVSDGAVAHRLARRRRFEFLNVARTGVSVDTQHLEKIYWLYSFDRFRSHKFNFFL